MNGIKNKNIKNSLGAKWNASHLAVREVSKALKNYKIVNEVNILWRLVAVGNG